MDSLVLLLGDADYRKREDAQQRLEALGESALPLLVKYLSNSNSEISSRVESVIRTPGDPRLCADLAFELIATTDPDWMEKGVHMLFESPVEVLDPFVKRVATSTGLVRRVCEPVVAQLQDTVRRWQHFLKRHRKLLDGKADQAAREFTMHTESNLYEAEAAYWTANDILLDAAQDATVPDNGPARSATSKPAEK